jgi:two-component system sensor histidine kinase BaeS
VRAHLVGAMIAVAVTGVALSGLFVTRAVDAELAASARHDLRVSANSTAQIAAAIYVEAGGWTPRSIRALNTVARSRGDAIVVLAAGARPVPGSPAPARARARGGVRAAVVVAGRRVGTVVATRRDRVGTVDSQLTEQINGLLVRAALLAGALALVVALGLGLRLARPLQRLTEVAGRMEGGELESAATGSGGGRELTALARTMDRLAAALRRQDEVRRATAADVSHELRGALVGVFTRIDALQEGLVDDEPTMFAQLERDARRLRRLVYDVHRLTEAQRPALFIDKAPIALDELVRDRVEGLADEFRARSISLTHAVAPTRVTGDPERLAQVLDNLLSNALRYTDPGGRVLVSLSARDGEATIDVADTGIGIAPEYLGRVFDRFWRAPGARSRAAEGSGVGLALVSELVRAHGGAVEVSSRPGDGTSFQVRLPLVEGAAGAAPPAPQGEPAPAPGARAARRPRVAPGFRNAAKPRGALVEALSRGRDAMLDLPDVPRVDADPGVGAAGH